MHEKEKEQLAALTPLQRRYLSRRLCWLCDYPLNRTGCPEGVDPCTEEVRIERRKCCLKEYKPRPWSRKK